MVSKLSEELLKFYQCINKKDLVKSKLSYNTILGRLKGSNEFVEVEDFESILNTTIHEDKKIKVTKSLVEYICDFFDYVSRDEQIKAENTVKRIYKLLDDDTTTVEMNDFIYRIKKDLDTLEFSEKIKDNIDRASYYGISIMGISDEYELEIFRKIIAGIDNFKLVPIEDKTKIAILNKNTEKDKTMLIGDEEEKFNAYTLYKEANNEYYKHNYQRSLELFSLLFRNEGLKISTCGKIGLCYMRLKKYDVASDYLTLATNINERNIPKFDYTDLIFQLKNKVVSEDKKSKVKMFEEEFRDDMNNYYGIDCMDNIINSVNSGFTIADACNFMNLSEEEKNIVYLIYARECYYNCDYRNGDKFLNLVQKSKTLTNYVKGILEVVRVNKYYYKNRKRKEPNAKILKLSNN